MALECYTHRKTNMLYANTSQKLYEETLLTMFLTSVGEVAMGLSLNAVGGHGAQ